jgi:hypothetical protein
MKLAPLMDEYVKRSPHNDWAEDCDRFIGFIDIMGFKDLVARKPHQEIKHMLLQMNQTRSILLNMLAESHNESSEATDTRVRSISFSDSVVFVTKSDSPKDLFNLSVALKICQEATIQSGLPTKGAISFGKLTVDFERSIFFGQPLIDAYLLQDQLHYYGIIVDNNAEAQLKKIIQSGNEYFPYNHFINLPTPLKSGKVTHFNIRLNSIQEDQLDYLFNSVCGHARKYVDNTIELYNSMRAQNNGNTD